MEERTQPLLLALAMANTQNLDEPADHLITDDVRLQHGDFAKIFTGQAATIREIGQTVALRQQSFRKRSRG